MLGKLSWEAIPFHDPIPLITSAVVLLAAAAIGIWVWRKGWWPYLRDEYITSTDHKRIGIMYIVLALLMLVRGFADALMMRFTSPWRSALHRVICRPNITTRSSPRTAQS